MNSFFPYLLGEVYVPCIHRMPGGVIVGDSGLCCGPAFNVMCDVDCSSAITSHCLFVHTSISLSKRDACNFWVFHGQKKLFERGVKIHSNKTRWSVLNSSDFVPSFVNCARKIRLVFYLLLTVWGCASCEWRGESRFCLVFNRWTFYNLWCMVKFWYHRLRFRLLPFPIDWTTDFFGLSILWRPYKVLIFLVHKSSTQPLFSCPTDIFNT